MHRSREAMSIRDAKCREIADAFARAGIGSRHNRMPLMPGSSVVAWEGRGPTGQRRAIVTVDDDGHCRVSVTEVCAVAAGSSGVDMLGGMPSTMFCELPAATSNLGEEVLRRLRAEDLRVGGHAAETAWAGDLGLAAKDRPSAMAPLRVAAAPGDTFDSARRPSASVQIYAGN